MNLHRIRVGGLRGHQVAHNDAPVVASHDLPEGEERREKVGEVVRAVELHLARQLLQVARR